MAGEAKTDNFMLGSATICLGPQASLMALGTDQSIGLVKNVKFDSAPTQVELTQGVRNALVHSTQTGNPVTVAGEVYEYSPANLMYAASLDGSSFAFTPQVTSVKTVYAAPVGPALLGLNTLELLSPTGIAPGNSIAVQVGAKDQIFVRKVVSLAADVATLDYGLPVAIPIGAPIHKVSVIALGSHDEPPYLACKIIGELANGKSASILIPKVKISSGISVAFQTEAYQNMPWSIRVYDLLPTDPFYADFATASPQGRPVTAKLAM